MRSTVPAVLLTIALLTSCTIEDEAYTDSDYVEFDLPEDFDYDHMRDYKLIDGVLSHDPSPQSIEEETAEIKANLAATDYVVIKVLEAQATCEELPKGKIYT